MWNFKILNKIDNSIELDVKFENFIWIEKYPSSFWI